MPRNMKLTYFGHVYGEGSTTRRWVQLPDGSTNRRS